MAQLLLINTISKRDVNDIGDIVGIHPDSQIFDPNEQAIYDIVSISDLEANGIEIIEEVRAIKDEITNEYEFINDIEVINTAKIELLWKKNTDSDWKKLKIKSKYKYFYDGNIKDKYSEKEENKEKVKIKDK